MLCDKRSLLQFHFLYLSHTVHTETVQLSLTSSTPLFTACRQAQDHCTSKVYRYSSSQSDLSHCYGNSHAIQDHTVLPATRQRWHSRLYPSRSWYSIKWTGDMQGWVDLVGLLHTEMVYPPEDGHPSEVDAVREDSRGTLVVMMIASECHVGSGAL